LILKLLMIEGILKWQGFRLAGLFIGNENAKSKR
jgi:hypothetical protein